MTNRPHAASLKTSFARNTIRYCIQSPLSCTLEVMDVHHLRQSTVQAISTDGPADTWGVIHLIQCPEFTSLHRQLQAREATLCRKQTQSSVLVEQHNLQAWIQLPYIFKCLLVTQLGPHHSDLKLSRYQSCILA